VPLYPSAGRVGGGAKARRGAARIRPAPSTVDRRRADDVVAGSGADRAGGVRAQQGVARICTLLLASVLPGAGRRSSRRPSSPAQPAATPVATREQLRPRLHGGEGPVPNPGRRRRSNAASPRRRRRRTTCPRGGGLLGGYGAGGRMLGARRRGAQ
jgi:hypothetical protein